MTNKIARKFLLITGTTVILCVLYQSSQLDIHTVSEYGVRDKGNALGSNDRDFGIVPRSASSISQSKNHSVANWTSPGTVPDQDSGHTTTHPAADYVADWRTIETGVLYAYSAHLDPRRGTGWVKVFGAMHRDHLKDPVSCTLSVGGVNKSAVRAVIVNVNPHDVMFPDVDVKCPFDLDPWTLPDDSWVSLSVGTNSSSASSAKLKIEQAFKRKGHRTFTVCLWAPLHTDTSTWMIEWIEANLLFGAELIYVYELNVGADTARVLEHYQDLGVVKVLPWSKPKPVTGKKIDHDNYQLTMIGDCQQRNMNQTRYVAGFDLDELIVPREPARNWQDMISGSGCAKNPSFAASHMLFQYNEKSHMDSRCTEQLACRDFALGDETCRKPSMHFLRSMCTTERLQRILTYPTRTKYLASPEIADRFHIHKPGLFANVCRMNFTIGALHHYRKSSVGGSKPNANNTMVDRTMHLYWDQLLLRCQGVYTDLQNK